MIPQVVTVGPLAAANPALLAASQTPVSGTALTLTAVQPDVARRILLTYGNEASARTLRVTGTNATGNPIRETLTVPSGAGGTVATTQDFLTVTQAMPLGSGWTAAATLGTNGVASSPWKITSIHFGPANISVAVVVSGTVNYSIEHTYTDLNSNGNIIGSQSLGNYPPVPTSFTHPILQALTANDDSAYNEPIQAWRLVVNSGATGAASVTATAIQAGTVNAR